MVVRFEKFFIGFLYCYNNACIRKKSERKEKKEMTNKKEVSFFMVHFVSKVTKREVLSAP